MRKPTLIFCDLFILKERIMNSEMNNTFSDPEIKKIQIGPHNIRVFITGKQHTASGIPTVVFENGLGQSIEHWGSLLTKVGEFAPVIAYDRPGIGGSKESEFTPSPANVTSLLKNILEHIDAEPPYILVGFSLGGPYVRMYAATYQDDVAGVVYIDPADFTHTEQNFLEVFEEIGSGPEGLEEYWNIYNSLMQESHHGQAYLEWVQLFALFNGNFTKFNKQAPPISVPQVILCSTKEQIPLGEYSFDFDAFAKLDTQHMSIRLMEWVTSLDEGYFVATPSSPHKIHSDDQELVVWAIKRVMFPDPSNLLIEVILEKDEKDFINEYHQLKSVYPTERFGEYFLNHLGYRLLYGNKPQKALSVFKLNVAEFPEASNPYDSLGECYIVLGNNELAIKNYSRSLELDPNNKNAKHKIQELQNK
jgi:pimeloyl-ACP methyl ester carboxylesterase